MNQTIEDHKPPRLAQRFLRWYCKPELLEDIEGDIHEDFNKRFTRSGKGNARFYYLLDVIRFFRPFVIKKLFKTQNHNTMFKLNTLIAFRNLAKNKLYSFINLTGLAIGIAACLTITHYVVFQLSFDRFHENEGSIYRVNTTTYQNEEYSGTGIYCGSALGPALQRDVPEIATFTRIHPEYNGAVMNRVVDSVNANPFHEEDIIYVEPAFLDMFSFELIEGNPETALNDPNSILISESMATKYFGKDASDAFGQTMKAAGGWAPGNYQITGIFKDVPANSHLKFDFLKPLSKLLQNGQYTNEGADWGWTNFFMYVQLIEQATEASVETKIADLMHQYTPEDLEASSSRQVLSLQPLADIHLSAETDDGDGDFAQQESMGSIYFMILIAVFILLIAWINFINLSTAKATERGTEIGIKKALGAFRKQLIWQFLTESFWINFLGVLLAISLTYLFLPVLGNMIGEPLRLQPTNGWFIIGVLAMIFIGPLLAGIYPAFILSSFRTVNALKGASGNKSKYQFNLRKALVVFQFVISTLLIAGTFIVSKQMDYMQNQDTGMDMSKVLVIKGPSVDVTRAKFDAFKNGMSAFASVESFATSRSIPGAGYNFATSARKLAAAQSTEQRIDVTWVDKNFFETYGINLTAGRDFKEAVADGPEEAVISEATAKAFGLGTAEEAIGSKILISGDTVSIRGVVSDHNWQSLHKGYTPSAFLFIPATVRYMSLKINPQNTRAVIDEAEKQFTAAFPGNPLEYYFQDDFFNRQYETDRELKQIFNAFAGFAVFAACLGLFGLASYSVVQKAKEIGIRRVLGASSANITLLFSKKYLFLILVANIIAIPAAYLGMREWLQNFAFSVPITVELFVLPAGLLLLIAALTVSFQTAKAAMANPVKNLRSE